MLHLIKKIILFSSLAIRNVRELSVAGEQVAKCRSQLSQKEASLYREIENEHKTYQRKIQKRWMLTFEKSRGPNNFNLKFTKNV